MASNNDFYKNSGGSILHLVITQNGVVMDLTTATQVNIILEKTDGTTVIKTATVENPPGTDGKIKYIFTTADLDIVGTWKAQGFVRFSATEQVYTSIVVFKVKPNLDTIP